MAHVVTSLDALEILDSRGRPTVQVSCAVDGAPPVTAAVPSGASTGRSEALELRDGDARYGGFGCRKAVQNVDGPIAEALIGQSFASQRDLDQALVALDGTDNKGRLGANAILGVSLAFARATAEHSQTPLFQHFASLVGNEECGFPRLTINLFSGGIHGGKQVPIQDVLLVPSQAGSIGDALAQTYDVYMAAAAMMNEQYGMRLLTADEGGLAPPFESAEEMLAAAVGAIERAGYTPGTDFHLAMDVASSHFYEDGRYWIDGNGKDAGGMIDRLLTWLDDYPIASIEDGLAEDDWANWPTLCERVAGRCLVVGDDLLCTNSQRIQRAIDAGACDTLLLKVNQVGTLTEAAEARRLAQAAGWQVTISVRSGETEDDWAADLAVGWYGDQFKNGSIMQSERLAKYNRLLNIESKETLPVRPWPSHAD